MSRTTSWISTAIVVVAVFFMIRACNQISTVTGHAANQLHQSVQRIRNYEQQQVTTVATPHGSPHTWTNSYGAVNDCTTIPTWARSAAECP